MPYFEEVRVGILKGVGAGFAPKDFFFLLPLKEQKVHIFSGENSLGWGWGSRILN